MPKHFILLLILIAGCHNSDPERDKIVFNGIESAVRDSIVAMNALMEKLPSPASKDRIKSWYFTDKDILDINGSRYNFVTTTLNQYEVLNSFDHATKERFINLIRFFRSNHLTSCREDYSMAELDNEYYYDYRNISEEALYLRDIVLHKPEQFQRYKDRAFIRILDVRDGLLLLADTELAARPLTRKDLWRDTSDRIPTTKNK